MSEKRLTDEGWVMGLRRLVVLTLVLALTGAFVDSASASGTTYYAAPGGVSSGPCDQANPCAFSYALSKLACGDTLLAAGTHSTPYVEDVMRTLPIICTPTRPIMVMPLARSAPIIKGLVWLTSPTWLDWNNVDVTWNPTGHNSSQYMMKMNGGGNWTIENSQLSGAKSSAALYITKSSSLDPVPSNWKVQYDCIHDTFESNDANQDQLIYVNIGTATNSGGLITRNLLFNGPNGWGVKLAGPSSGNFDAAGVSVTYNTIYNTGGANILVGWTSKANILDHNLLDRTGGEKGGGGNADANLRGYGLTNNTTVYSNTAGYEAFDGLLEKDYPKVTGSGLVDASDNIYPGGSPTFDTLSCSGFHPGDLVAQSYGRYAP